MLVGGVWASIENDTDCPSAIFVLFALVSNVMSESVAVVIHGDGAAVWIDTADQFGGTAMLADPTGPLAPPEIVIVSVVAELGVTELGVIVMLGAAAAVAG
jgi:hypothetical protein